MGVVGAGRVEKNRTKQFWDEICVSSWYAEKALLTEIDWQTEIVDPTTAM